MKASDRVMLSGFVVSELTFWSISQGVFAIAEHYFSIGSQNVMNVLALCLGKNDSMPGAYEMASMVVSLCSLLILRYVYRERLT